jgi:hypothetical protein
MALIGEERHDQLRIILKVLDKLLIVKEKNLKRHSNLHADHSSLKINLRADDEIFKYSTV